MIRAHLATRRAIQTLRGGVVSRESVRLITVGTEQIESELSQGIEKLKNGKAKKELLVVKADWGFGKSHVRMLLSDQLIRNEIPFIADSIDGRASSLSHMHRAVWRWLEGIQIGFLFGLRTAVHQGALNFNTLKEWSNHNRESKLAEGFRHILRGHEWGWIIALGHLYRTPDYGYQHPKALSCLTDCADMLAASGKGGLVLLLDEAENIDKQYNIMGRRKSYETLQILVHHPHILPVLFVTDRFTRLIAEDQNLGAWKSWRSWPFLACDFVREFGDRSHLAPPMLRDDLARSLADKIVVLYTSIYGPPNSGFSTAKVIEFWKRTPTCSPRLLVRLLINELDLSNQRKINVCTLRSQQSEDQFSSKAGTN